MPPCRIPSPSLVEEHRCLSGLPGDEGVMVSPPALVAGMAGRGAAGAMGREAAAAAATAAATA